MENQIFLRIMALRPAISVSKTTLFHLVRLTRHVTLSQTRVGR
nr:hypothetical protein [Pantoea sp. IMH]